MQKDGAPLSALALNSSWAVSEDVHLLGSWVPGETAPSYLMFLPNILYRPGLLLNAMYWMGAYAGLVSQQIP